MQVRVQSSASMLKDLRTDLSRALHFQAIAAIQAQQQLQRQMLAQQGAQGQVLLQQQAAMPGIPGLSAPGAAVPGLSVASAVNPELALDAPPSQANKKQRELYIGNLASGSVTTEMLRELFNAVLANMVPDPISLPPVLEVKPDPTGRGVTTVHACMVYNSVKVLVLCPLLAPGRFAFIELRTAALALAALHLDKVEVGGRQINIGRPKGYVDPPGLEQQAKLSMAQMFAAQGLYGCHH